MASGTWNWYSKGLAFFLSGDTDFDADTIKMGLVTSEYAAYASPGNEVSWSQPSSWEVSGDGYTDGGKTLTGNSVTSGADQRFICLFADDAQWPSSSISARYAIVYASQAAARRLIGYCPFSATVTSDNGTFTVDLDGVNGFLYVRASS